MKTKILKAVFGIALGLTLTTASIQTLAENSTYKGSDGRTLYKCNNLWRVTPCPASNTTPEYSIDKTTRIEGGEVVGEIKPNNQKSTIGVAGNSSFDNFVSGSKKSSEEPSLRSPSLQVSSPKCTYWGTRAGTGTCSDYSKPAVQLPCKKPSFGSRFFGYSGGDCETTQNQSQKPNTNPLPILQNKNQSDSPSSDPKNDTQKPSAPRSASTSYGLDSPDAKNATWCVINPKKSYSKNTQAICKIGTKQLPDEEKNSSKYSIFGRKMMFYCNSISSLTQKISSKQVPNSVTINRSESCKDSKLTLLVLQKNNTKPTPTPKSQQPETRSSILFNQGKNQETPKTAKLLEKPLQNPSTQVPIQTPPVSIPAPDKAIISTPVQVPAPSLITSPATTIIGETTFPRFTSGGKETGFNK